MAALYHSSLTNTIRTMLREQEFEITSLLGRVNSYSLVNIDNLLEQDKIGRRCFVNLNKPEDLAGGVD